MSNSLLELAAFYTRGGLTLTIILIALLYFAFYKFSKLDSAGIDISLYQTIVLCVEIVVLSIAAVSISRFLFLLGKSFMVESLRNANRAHAK